MKIIEIYIILQTWKVGWRKSFAKSHFILRNPRESPRTKKGNRRIDQKEVRIREEKPKQQTKENEDKARIERENEERKIFEEQKLEG